MALIIATTLALSKPSSLVGRKAFVAQGAATVLLGVPAARAVSGGGKDFSNTIISGADFSGQSGQNLRGKECVSLHAPRCLLRCCLCAFA